MQTTAFRPATVKPWTPARAHLAQAETPTTPAPRPLWVGITALVVGPPVFGFGAYRTFRVLFRDYSKHVSGKKSLPTTSFVALSIAVVASATLAIAMGVIGADIIGENIRGTSAPLETETGAQDGQ